MTLFTMEVTGEPPVGATLTSACLRAFGAPCVVEYGRDETYWFEFESRLGKARLVSAVDAAGRRRYHVRAEPAPTASDDEWAAVRAWLAYTEHAR